LTTVDVFFIIAEFRPLLNSCAAARFIPANKSDYLLRS